MKPVRIVVVGAGPAGMAAAVRASECGARVTVIDDNPGAGGQIWRGSGTRNEWLARFWAAPISVETSTQVVSVDGKNLLVERPGGWLEIPFDKLILATGAREIFLPFPGWTLPGVMGVGGLQTLAKSGLPVAGKRIVVAGTGPLLLAVAAYLKKHGAAVTLIAEQAKRSTVMSFAAGLVRHPGKLAQAGGLQLSLAGVPQHYNCWVEAAEGNGKLERLRLRKDEKIWMEECDFAAIGYGLWPNVELASLLGCEVRGAAIATGDFQESSVADIFCAGECTGIGGVELAVIDGEIAGYAAAGKLKHARALFASRNRARHFADALNSTFALRPELKQLPKPETLVCRCEDVTFGELERHGSFRAAKLHARCGMGPCQGRVCGPALHFLFRWESDRLRPPILATRIGTLATEPRPTPADTLEESIKSQ